MRMPASEPKPELLAVSGAKKSFSGNPVLKGVDIDLRQGEFLALLGPSGCGKTTLLRIIAGLEFQDEGQVRIAGEPVDGLTAAERNVALVFQSYALYPHLTVRQNIALPLVMRRLSVAERLPLLRHFVSGRQGRMAQIASDVESIATSMAISHLLDRKPSQLSGGQKQRVAVARALVRKPRLLLMDEPLSNLDATLRVQLRREIVSLHVRHHATTVYVTHDQAEAMSMADRIAVFLGGELHQVGTPAEIYGRPTSLAVAEFIGSPKINVLPAVVEDGGLLVAGFRLPGTTDLPRGTRITAAVRPECVSMVPEQDGMARAEVVSREYLGSETLVVVALEGTGTELTIKAEQAGHDSIPTGNSVGIRLSGHDLHLFGEGGSRVDWRPA